MTRAAQRAALWQRLRLTQSSLCTGYERHAEAESDSEIFNLAHSIQRDRREISQLTAALRKAYGRNVLWVEGEDD